MLMAKGMEPLYQHYTYFAAEIKPDVDALTQNGVSEGYRLRCDPKL